MGKSCDHRGKDGIMAIWQYGNILLQRVDSLQHGRCDGDQGEPEETVSKRIVNVGIAKIKSYPPFYFGACQILTKNQLFGGGHYLVILDKSDKKPSLCWQ